MMRAMTPTPPLSPPVGLSPRAGGMPSAGRVGADALGTLSASLTFADDFEMTGVGPAAFLLTCFRCSPDTAEPYPEALERDSAAVRHVEAHRHAVLLCTDGVPDERRRPVVLLCGDEGWRWICTTCAWLPGADLMSPPVESGQLALVEFADHVCEANR